MNLNIILIKYPQCLESRAKLSAILRDLYPSERRESILFWIYQGTPNIDNNRITEKRCMMDYFILVINKDEHITSSEFALNYDGARSDCGMKVDLYSLCGKLTRAASDYYHSNKELFEFFQYQLIQ